MERQSINQLTTKELLELRKEIVLNSLYLVDYENSFCIDKNSVYDFFDGYCDYLCELAKEQNISDFLKLDNETNLINYFYMVN